MPRRAPLTRSARAAYGTVGAAIKQLLLTSGPVNANDIVRKTGFSGNQITPALTRLAELGEIRRSKRLDPETHNTVFYYSLEPMVDEDTTTEARCRADWEVVNRGEPRIRQEVDEAIERWRRRRAEKGVA